MITEILCRFDLAKQTPVVFLSDTIQGNKVQVWSEGSKAAASPLDYYHMTRHLSAADERVLMERFAAATNRDAKTVKIRHRLPRVSKTTPNLLANTGASVGGSSAEVLDAAQGQQKAPNVRRSAAKPIDQQQAPQGPSGDLPQAGEQPAAPVQAQPQEQPALTPAAPANELPSASILRRITELNERINTLNANVTALAQQHASAVTDLNASKEACQQLISEYSTAIEAEAAEELRKRQEMLAQVTASLAPAATAAPTPTPEPVKEQTPPPAAPPKAAGSKPASKPASKTPPKAGSKPASKSAAPAKK